MLVSEGLINTDGRGTGLTFILTTLLPAFAPLRQKEFPVTIHWTRLASRSDEMESMAESVAAPIPSISH